MGIAKELWEMHGMVHQLTIGCRDALVVGIGDDASTMVDNFHPFRFGPEYNTGLLKEKSLFLHATAIGHDYAGVLLQHVDFEKGSRFSNADRVGKVDVE